MFGLVVMELVYELVVTYDNMKDYVKHYGFWQKMLYNFLVICVFFPAFMNFMIMREVIKINVNKSSGALNVRLAN
jgi:hypothetical protein